MFGVNLLCCAVVGELILPYGHGLGAMIGAGTWVVLGVIGLWQGWFD